MLRYVCTLGFRASGLFNLCVCLCAVVGTMLMPMRAVWTEKTEREREKKTSQTAHNSKTNETKKKNIITHVSLLDQWCLSRVQLTFFSSSVCLCAFEVQVCAKGARRVKKHVRLRCNNNEQASAVTVAAFYFVYNANEHIYLIYALTLSLSVRMHPCVSVSLNARKSGFFLNFNIGQHLS